MITLPYPPSVLNPNRPAHWTKKAKAKSACRQRAGWETLAAGVKVDWDGPIDVHLSFYPPDRIRRDADNALASCKAYLDGIADALKVDDNRFRLHQYFGDPVKGGKLVVQILKAEA